MPPGYNFLKTTSHGELKTRILPFRALLLAFYRCFSAVHLTELAEKSERWLESLSLPSPTPFYAPSKTAVWTNDGQFVRLDQLIRSWLGYPEACRGQSAHEAADALGLRDQVYKCRKVPKAQLEWGKGVSGGGVGAGARCVACG